MNFHVRDQGIRTACSRYSAKVQFVSSGSGAQGYQGTLGSIPVHRGLFGTADDAWDALLERLVLVRPGAPLLTSVEFGDRVRRGIELIGGRIGSVTERQRLEIRAMSGADSALPVPSLSAKAFHDFQIFLMLRQYRDDAPSRDIRQERVGGPHDPYRFPSLGAAAEYVLQAVNLALTLSPADAATSWVPPAESMGARGVGDHQPSGFHAASLDIRLGPTPDFDGCSLPAEERHQARTSVWPEHAP